MTATQTRPTPSVFRRLMHLLMVLGIGHQLLVSELMEPPWEDDAVGVSLWFFEMHEIVGMTLLGVLALFSAALWASRRQRGDAPMLPWFRVDAVKALFAQASEVLQTLFGLRFPQAGESQRLAAAVEGLGLCTVLLMGMSGVGLWLTDGHMEWLEELHEFGSALMWAYVIGHGVMGIAHHFNGEPELRRMFSLRRVRDLDARGEAEVDHQRTRVV